MRRRDFIALAGSVSAAWPFAARAQQDAGMRRMAWLVNGSEGDPGWTDNWVAFKDTLAKLGWIEGRNLRIDLRFASGDINRMRAAAADMVGLAPHVIVTNSGVATQVMKAATQSIPIVFSQAGDAVANGLVKNIARPESNVTGFSVSEPTIFGKMLALLKEGAPHVNRVAVLFNPELLATGPSYLAAIDAAAPGLSVQTVTMPYRDAVDVVRAIDAFAAAPNGGLLSLPPPPTVAILTAILRLAEEHRLPAVFTSGVLAAAGGLIAYGASQADLHRRAATSVDRLLRGAKVSELPVQFPTKYDLVINLRTARTIGLTIPDTLLARADEVIK
jgi:putative tryptophan/tyrosine transport system substrate-binding protein